MTRDVDARGFYVLRHHTLATLRFHDVDELHLDGFNHQNAIFGLSISRAESSKAFARRFRVEFEPAFGLTGTFLCSRAEVLEAKPFPRAKLKA